MTIRSFRLRLTAWYLLLFSLLFVAFSVFLYGVLSKGLRERVDETLLSEAGTAAGMYEDELSETNGDRPASAAEAVAGSHFPGTVVAVVAEGRGLAANTRGPGGDLEGRAPPPPHPRMALRQPRSGCAGRGLWGLGGGRRRGRHNSIPRCYTRMNCCSRCCSSPEGPSDSGEAIIPR